MLITIKKVFKDGVLVPVSDKEALKEKSFFKGLTEGTVVEETIEVVGEGKTYSQLAKIHLCARLISEETGSTFEKEKKNIKIQAGLITPEGEIKSFGDCSKEELSRAIKTAMEIGEFLNLNLY